MQIKLFHHYFNLFDLLINMVIDNLLIKVLYFLLEFIEKQLTLIKFENIIDCIKNKK